MNRSICALVVVVASAGIACGREAASPTRASADDGGPLDIGDASSSAAPAASEEGVAGIIAPQRSSNGSDEEGRMGSKKERPKPPPAAK